MFDPISIGLAIAGAALSNKARSDALAKQRRMAVESQQRSLQAQNKATDAAMKRVAEFAPEQRQERQDQIAQDLTQQYEGAASQPITAQGVQVGQTLPDGGGTTDYVAARARETAKAAESNRALAALFGRLGAAGQLRRDEAVGIGDTAGEIGRIQTGADRMAQIDQIGIDSVQPSIGMSLAGQALTRYGLGKMATPAAASKVAPNIFSGSYANPDVLAMGSWLRR